MYAPFMFNKTEQALPYVLFYDNGDQIVPAHWHKELELIFSVEGATNIRINEHMYEIPKGEACLINGGDTHFYFASKNHKRIVIIFDLAIIEGTSNSINLKRELSKCFSTNDKTSINFSDADKKILFDCIHELERLNYDKAISRELLIRSNMFRILSLFSNPEYRRRDELSHYEPDNKHMLRLEKVLDYIEKNYNNTITLPEIASVAGLEPSYFARFFKTYTNMTFVEYLTSYRISKAQTKLIAYPDRPVSLISEEVGFMSIKTFNRAFKTLVKTTPLNFRKVNI